MAFFKKNVWNVLAVVTSLIVLTISVVIYSKASSVKIGDEVVKYENVLNLIDKKKEELEQLEDELEDAKTMIQKRNEVRNKYNELVGKIKDKEFELEKIDETISVRELQLEKIENVIIKKKEEPTELLAGTYVVGTDLFAGRYVVTNIGRGTNFFVYTEDGKIKDNVILGDGVAGSGDYVFFVNDKDVIKTKGHIKLTPIQ